MPAAHCAGPLCADRLPPHHPAGQPRERSCAEAAPRGDWRRPRPARARHWAQPATQAPRHRDGRSGGGPQRRRPPRPPAAERAGPPAQQQRERQQRQPRARQGAHGGVAGARSWCSEQGHERGPRAARCPPAGPGRSGSMLGARQRAGGSGGRHRGARRGRGSARRRRVAGAAWRRCLHLRCACIQPTRDPRPCALGGAPRTCVQAARRWRIAGALGCWEWLSEHVRTDPAGQSGRTRRRVGNTPQEVLFKCSVTACLAPCSSRERLLAAEQALAAQNRLRRGFSPAVRTRCRKRIGGSAWPRLQAPLRSPVQWSNACHGPHSGQARSK